MHCALLYEYMMVLYKRVWHTHEGAVYARLCDTITELLTLSKWENIIEQTKVTALVLTNYPQVIYLRGQYSTVPRNGPAVHNDTAVN